MASPSAMGALSTLYDPDSPLLDDPALGDAAALGNDGGAPAGVGSVVPFRGGGFPLAAGPTGLGGAAGALVTSVS